MPFCENSEGVALQFTIRLGCDSICLLAEVVKHVLDSNWGNSSEEVKVSFVLGVLWFFNTGSTVLTSSTIVSTNMNSYFHRQVTYL